MHPLRQLQRGLKQRLLTSVRLSFLLPVPRSYGEGCNGGDVIDVVRYTKNFGLPDESCMVRTTRVKVQPLLC